MSLSKTNPYLQSIAGEAALLISARSSSAVEGIRAPFKKSAIDQPESIQAFVCYWKERTKVIRRASSKQAI